MDDILYKNLLIGIPFNEEINIGLTFFGMEIISYFFNELVNDYGIKPNIKFLNFEYFQSEHRNMYFSPSCLTDYRLEDFLKEKLIEGQHIYYLINFKKHTFVIIKEIINDKPNIIILDSIGFKSLHLHYFVNKINILLNYPNIYIINDRFQFDRFSCRIMAISLIYELEKLFVLKKFKNFKDYFIKNNRSLLYL